MSDDYFKWLRENLTSDIKIKSMEEGQIVFAKEPLVTYTGKLGIIQLL